MTTKHIIHDRASFDAALERAIEEVERLKAQRRDDYYWGIFPSTELQLHAIRYWMRDGREPTLEQRASIDITIRFTRELDTVRVDDELAAWVKLVTEVALYAMYVPSDERVSGTTQRWYVTGGGALGQLQDTARRLAKMDPSEKRRVLELDAIPYPEGAGFPNQPKP